MTIARALVIAVAACLLLGSAATAQSLGDVARQEAARRKAVQSSGKVYTNDSLQADTSQPSPAPASAATSASSSADSAASAPSTSAPGGDSDAKAAGEQTKADAAPADDAKHDEAYWKKRLADQRASVDRAKTLAEALQSRINALTADFTSRSDPAQRDQIFADRQRALQEQERIRKEIEDGTKAIADIQEEARRAGAPAAWYR